MTVEATKRARDMDRSPFPVASVLRTDGFGCHALEGARDGQTVTITFPNGRKFEIEGVEKGTTVSID